MTPQIQAQLTQNIQEFRQPNLSYRLNEENVAGKVDNLDSVKQAIYHILMTERYSNPIYDDNYGVELEQYVGKDIGFIQADIEQTLREALTQDDRITDVIVDSVTQQEKGSCLIEFTVLTIYGNIEESLNVLH